MFSVPLPSLNTTWLTEAAGSKQPRNVVGEARLNNYQGEDNKRVNDHADDKEFFTL